MVLLRQSLLAVSNLLAAVTGGMLLATSVAALQPDPFLGEFGRLAALVAGSALGFLLNVKVGKWDFSRQANLPFLAILADGLVLTVVTQVPADRAVAWAVFLLFCVRWAAWSSSRSVRASVAPRLGMAVHYVEAAAFGGLVLGAVIPLVVPLVTGVAWAIAFETLLLIDAGLFLAAALLDHIVARLLPAVPTPAPGAAAAAKPFPLELIVAMLVCLTIPTQMIIFAFHGALGLFKVPGAGLLRDLLVPAVYLGAMISAVINGLAAARLQLTPGGWPAVLYWQRAVPAWWLFITGVGSAVAAVWMAPHWTAAVLALVAMLSNGTVFTASLVSIRTQCGGPRLVRAMGAYFPLAIAGYAALSLALTHAIPDLFAAQVVLSTVGAVGLLATLTSARAT